MSILSELQITLEMYAQLATIALLGPLQAHKKLVQRELTEVIQVVKPQLIVLTALLGTIAPVLLLLLQQFAQKKIIALQLRLLLYFVLVVLIML